MALSYKTTLLTTDPSCLTEPHPLVDSITILNRISSERLPNPFWHITEKLDGQQKVFNAARRQIHRVVEDIIAARQHSSDSAVENNHDFLSTLLQEDARTDPIALRDCLVTLLFAGRDTTQHALSWSLHELSKVPVWLDKMRAETLSRGPPGHAVQYEDLSNYHIHLAVLYETLRLWPAVSKNARIALRDDVLPAIPEAGYSPIRVAKGEWVGWFDTSMMRSEKVWGPDAELFNPARHLDDEGHFVKPPQPKFHSFGAGPRLCPGAQLASFEFVAIWASILPFFDLKPVDMEERRYTDGLTMSMQDPFMITVHSRSL